MSQKKAVIFIGPPGAGKGTQAILLEKEFGFYHIESSQLIEGKFKTSKLGDSDYEEVQKEKKLFDDGMLISPAFITKLMAEEFKKASQENISIILSGSPRTVPEAMDETPILLNEYGKENIFVIHMPVSAETSIERNSHRRICQSNRHPIPFLPGSEDWKVCPEDGSPLITRGILDAPETIKVRLKEYKERTEPILDILKDKFGLKINLIDGEKPIDVRFKEIKEVIGENDND